MKKEKAKSGISFSEQLNNLMDHAKADEKFDVRVSVCEVLRVLDLASCEMTKHIGADDRLVYQHTYSPTQRLQKLIKAVNGQYYGDDDDDDDSED